MPRHAPLIDEEEVQLNVGPVTLGGNLALPPEAKGIVLFAHGSGSGRHSPRNRFVASHLNESALRRLGSRTKELKIIPGASHLFEEPGKLEEVAHYAAEWFGRYLTGAAAAR